MLRLHWQYSAKAAVDYMTAADYYATSPGDLLGKGFEHLDTGTMSPADVLRCLAHNLDPATGHVLRKHAKDGDRVGMDFTFNAPKSVTLAREIGGVDNAGDARVEAAHREAVEYAMGHIEADMKTRVRVGGADEDRVTGNLFAYRVTHRDTRINAGDQMPDPHLHDHVLVMNLTFDPVEEKFKAAQVAQIKHDAPYYEAIYHNRLACYLRDLGYGVRRKDKAFEVAGVSDELVKKFSRRREYIKAVAAKLGITRPESMDKLGATTRLGKATELVEDLNPYFVGRLSEPEKQQLAGLVGQRSYESSEEKAVGFAVGHLFERQSVVEERKLYETTLRQGIGSVTVEGVIAEAKRQGALLKDGQATTRAVLAEESRIIDFAREGKGTMRPLVPGGYAPTAVKPHTATPSPEQQSLSTLDQLAHVRKGIGRLSPEQAAVVDHILSSTDQVILVRGAAGTGKTHAMKTTIAAIDAPVAILAPTAAASRGVLRDDGFKEADTVAAFLQDKTWHDRIKNGVVYVDEAALLPIKDLSALTDIARTQHARLVLQGDPHQHKSVLRNGNMFRVLQEYAGLPVAELKDIRRQSGRYKEAVAAIESGDILKGHDIFTDLKWVRHVSDDKPLVDDYMHALATKRHDQSDRDRAIILAPTHEEGDAIGAEVRKRLKAAGKLGEDAEVSQLVPLHWSAPERADLEHYDGTETLVFHRNSGSFKAGQVVRIADWKPGDRFKSPEHFSVYRPAKLTIAPGDTIRATANVKDAQGRRVDNGSYMTVTAIYPKGIEVVTGKDTKRTLPADVGHIALGYVATSIGGQGKTVDRVFAAMGSESLPALRTEQFYTDLSRGRHQATIYTDLPSDQLRSAIQRTDARRSATELMQPRPKKKRRVYDRIKKVLDKARDRFKVLQAGLVGDTRERQREKERDAHER